MDRFVKVMLVLIALLLAVNFAKDLNSSSEAAAPPSFLQVGKSYKFTGSYNLEGEIMEIQNTGWVKIKQSYGILWVNTNVSFTITAQ
jgi:hypothetical protein